MKSEQEIREQLLKVKDALVHSDGAGTYVLQGTARAFEWALDEEEDKEEEK